MNTKPYKVLICLFILLAIFTGEQEALVLLGPLAAVYLLITATDEWATYKAIKRAAQQKELEQ